MLNDKSVACSSLHGVACGASSPVGSQQFAVAHGDDDDNENGDENDDDSDDVAVLILLLLLFVTMRMMTLIKLVVGPVGSQYTAGQPRRPQTRSLHKISTVPASAQFQLPKYVKILILISS